MQQKAIPFLLMRGGSSRGPFFNRGDLPTDLSELSEVLISVTGSGHPLNIDGVGGGNAVTTKVAMLSKSDDDWASINSGDRISPNASSIGLDILKYRCGHAFCIAVQKVAMPHVAQAFRQR